MISSLAEYVENIRSGQTTCEEFMHQTIEQIRRREPELHAYLSLNGQAIQQARDTDRRLKSGENVGVLCGAPISIKDNICIQDTITTCGSRMLEEFVAPYTATAVSRLREAGAIITGKTNMDEFAMGLTTEFGAFGPSRNPWNRDCVPGGSSGGSAVAVAASECLASLGSDTGGSVRNPASFCSVVGFKPTYGLISRHGLVSYANSIEQIGPITRTVKDAALMLNVVAGKDPNDDTTVDNGAVDYLENIEAGIEGKKIGVIKEMTGEGTSPDVLSAAKKTTAKLEGLGAQIQDVRIDMVKYSVAAYYTITSTEAGSNLARYDNILYGYDYSHDGFEFNSYISRARARFGPEVTRRIILGGFVPSAGHAGRYYLKAMKVKSRLTEEINEAFDKVDLLVSPTVPILPFRIGEKTDDPVSLFLVDFNTVTANLTGKPAISVPFEIAGGLPVGMQIMARPMKDKELLQAAYALEQTVSLPEAPP